MMRAAADAHHALGACPAGVPHGRARARPPRVALGRDLARPPAAHETAARRQRHQRGPGRAARQGDPGESKFYLSTANFLHIIIPYCFLL